MSSRDLTDEVSYRKTAFELAQISPWNSGAPQDGGEFAKVGRPLSDPAPGQIAYALDYRAPPPP